MSSQLAVKTSSAIAKASVLCALLVAGTLTAAAPATAVTPVPGTLPPATQVTINNGAGTQTDPHVSGDLASYTSQTGTTTQIRYFDFASGTDTGISNALPGGGSAIDSLSDVSGSTIVFTRAALGENSIWAFDVATAGPAVELDPQVGSRRRGDAIGGGTVAWIDMAQGSDGELVAYDLASASTQQLTSDAVIDRRPQVSADGNVIAWEHCPSQCDIYKAVKGASGWTVSAVTSTADQEADPDTNGSVVVYASNRATSQAGADIYWTPVGGGAESQLALDGIQRNPAVSGDLVVFESAPASGTNNDVFAYDLGTNALYQLTNTSVLSERLSDISVSPSGQVRVVWSVFEGTDFFDPGENVCGLAFQLPSARTLAAEVQPPVNPDGSSSFNANRGVVPLKFALSENGSPTCNLPPATLRLSRTGGTSPGPVDESVYSSPADSGSEFRIADCQYHYNVNSSALGPGSYLAEVLINGTVVGAARFELK